MRIVRVKVVFECDNDRPYPVACDHCHKNIEVGKEHVCEVDFSDFVGAVIEEMKWRLK